MDIVTDFGLDGEARKQAAHRLLEARREELIRRARRVLLLRLLVNGTATIDDVRPVVPVPDGVNPKAFGAVPGSLAVLHIIRPAGFVKTTRAVGHARPVTIWELVDRAAAFDWLKTHPDLTDHAAPADPQETAV